MAGAVHAHKLSATPFPYPLRQLLGLLLLAFQASTDRICTPTSRQAIVRMCMCVCLPAR